MFPFCHELHLSHHGETRGIIRANCLLPSKSTHELLRPTKPLTLEGGNSTVNLKQNAVFRRALFGRLRGELGSCAGSHFANRPKMAAANHFFDRSIFIRGPGLQQYTSASDVGGLFLGSSQSSAESRRRRGHESPRNMPRKKNMGPRNLPKFSNMVRRPVGGRTQQAKKEERRGEKRRGRHPHPHRPGPPARPSLLHARVPRTGWIECSSSGDKNSSAGEESEGERERQSTRAEKQQQKVSGGAKNAQGNCYSPASQDTHQETALEMRG